MGRKSEPGISFYPVNCDHIMHKKIRLLVNDHDSDGYWIWHCLINEGYNTRGYFLDCSIYDELEIFASDTCKKSIELVKKVIDSCLRRGLFDKRLYEEYQVLTSRRMQEVYLEATRERRRKGSWIELREELLLINIPEDSGNISILPRNNSILPRKNDGIPRNNPQSKVKESKVKESKVKEESAPASPARAGKEGKGEEKKPEPFWQALVDAFFSFCKENFSGEEPSFKGADPRHFKTIIHGLKRRAERRKQAWTQDYALRSLQYFLQCAYAEDWLRKHFLLSNLAEQFDAIFQRVQAAKKPDKQVPLPAPPVGEMEVQYLYERFLEDGLDPRLIQEGHFDFLQARQLIDLDERFIEYAVRIRLSQLMSSNQAADTRMSIAYQDGSWPSDPDCRQDKITRERIAKKFAVMEFFKHLRSLNTKNVFDAEPTPQDHYRD